MVCRDFDNLHALNSYTVLECDAMKQEVVNLHTLYWWAWLGEQEAYLCLQTLTLCAPTLTLQV